jgi:hypothetical protein
MKKLNNILKYKVASQGTLIRITKAWTIIFLILTSCSKAPVDFQGISATINGKQLNYSEVKVSSEPYCGTQKIYSLDAGDLLISIVCDSLVTGSYSAGLNYWSGTFTSVIKLTLVVGGELSGYFSGENVSGKLKLKV